MQEERRQAVRAGGGSPGGVRQMAQDDHLVKSGYSGQADDTQADDPGPLDFLMEAFRVKGLGFRCPSAMERLLDRKKDGRGATALDLQGERGAAVCS